MVCASKYCFVLDFPCWCTVEKRLIVGQWVERLTHNVEVVGWTPIKQFIKGPVVFLNKKLYPYCLVLVGGRTVLSVISWKI